MKVRILSRVIILDSQKNKILLIRNKGASFWYPPGGGWESEKENLLDCAKREVSEEVGLNVEIDRLLYVQDFQATEDTKFLEIFWLGNLKGQSFPQLNSNPELRGEVEEAKWFSKDELADIKVFPKRLKDDFWVNLEFYKKLENPFLGY